MSIYENVLEYYDDHGPDHLISVSHYRVHQQAMAAIIALVQNDTMDGIKQAIAAMPTDAADRPGMVDKHSILVMLEYYREKNML